MIENSADEIAAVVQEVYACLDGTWETRERDEELQKRFWSLVKKSKLNGVIRSRIGTEFLCNYRNLFD